MALTVQELIDILQDYINLDEHNGDKVLVFIDGCKVEEVTAEAVELVFTEERDD